MCTISIVFTLAGLGLVENVWSLKWGWVKTDDHLGSGGKWRITWRCACENYWSLEGRLLFPNWIFSSPIQNKVIANSRKFKHIYVWTFYTKNLNFGNNRRPWMTGVKWKQIITWLGLSENGWSLECVRVKTIGSWNSLFEVLEHTIFTTTDKVSTPQKLHLTIIIIFAFATKVSWASTSI